MAVVVAAVMLPLGLNDDEADFSDSERTQFKKEDNRQHIRSLTFVKTCHKEQKSPQGV